MSCLSFYPLDQAQCLACCMTDVNCCGIIQDPARLLPLPRGFFSVPPRVPTKSLLDPQGPWSLCLSFLGDFALELTDHVSSTLIQVSIPSLGSVSTGLSHRRCTWRGMGEAGH